MNEADHTHPLDWLRAQVEIESDAPLIHYLDAFLTRREVLEHGESFGSALIEAGLLPGERVALFLQNVPQYVIALLGVWHAGGIAVNVNPMYKARELHELLVDSGASMIVHLETLTSVFEAARSGTSVRTAISTGAYEFGVRNAPLASAGDDAARDVSAPTLDMTRLIASTPRRDAVTPVPGEPAVLTYTSGTTGPAKGAMISFANLDFAVNVLREVTTLTQDDVIAGLSPLFHVTGLVGQIGLSLYTGAPLVLAYRFDAEAAVDLIERHRATFAIGSITIFLALSSAPNATQSRLRSLRIVYSGGAPVARAVAAEFERLTGTSIHNIYGLTETTSPTACVPLGERAPEDRATGLVSVGRPVRQTTVRVLAEDGTEAAQGDLGELVIHGPQVVAGYWRNDEATSHAIVDGELHTGDIGYVDADGWVFVVDRLKDQINAGGFKVWPREVEDVLFEHPAIQDVAVVGAPDPYRGESVVAFVVLRDSFAGDEDGIIEFARERLAAFKYPRQVRFLPSLPRNAAGKVLRRELKTVAAAHMEGTR